MANLAPTPGWDNVFQLETDTPVLGGAGGVANSQAQALLNRTSFIEGPTGSSKVGHTLAGTGAVATTVESKLHESVSVKDFGAMGDGVTDDTVSIQTALNIANASNKRLYFPEGKYIVSSTLTINNAGEGLYLYGDTTSNYNTPFVSDAKSGSVLVYTGSTVMLQINGNASTVHVLIQNLSFAGNATADTGIKLNAGWFLTLEHCVFNGFSGANAQALYLTRDVGTFVGVTKITNCEFSNNDIHVFFDKPDTNVIVIDKCSFYTHTFGILSGDGVNSVSSRNVNITNCLFESVDADYDIFCYGGAQTWNIINNYFEQNDGTVNSPRILFGGGALYPINQSITITGNVFSKEIGGAGGDSLIFIDQANGVLIRNNWSAFPSAGVVSNKFSVTASSITNYDIDPFNAVFGASPYPVIINSDTTYAGFSDYTGTKLISGNIKFPSPAVSSTDPNVLDDYAEGNWTPSNSFVTLTINNTARYTKVGNLVHAFFDISFPVNAQGNLAEIVGLPFVRGSGATQTAMVTYSDYGALLYLRNDFTNGGNFYDASGTGLTNASLSNKRVIGCFIFNV